jgi:hypothetical protein
MEQFKTNQAEINQARVGMYAPDFEAIAVVDRESFRVELTVKENMRKHRFNLSVP